MQSQRKNEPPIVFAIRRGDLDETRRLVNDGAKLDVKDSDGRSLLGLASSLSFLHIVEYFVEDCRVSCNEEDTSGYTPIFYAIQSGCLNVVEFFLGHGVEMNKSCTLPIHYAATCGHLNIVKYLAERYGMLYNKNRLGCTPLILATQRGHLNVVKYIVEKMCDTNCGDVSGHTQENLNTELVVSLYKACIMGNLEIIKCLVAAGADVNKRFPGLLMPTCLCAAVHYGHLNVIEYLFSIQEKNPSVLPLYIAATVGHVNIVTYLCHKAEEYNVSDQFGTYTPLHAAAMENRVDVAKTLLERRAEVNARTYESVTPLMLACNSNARKIVQILIEKGAELNATDANGCAAIHFASGKGNLDAVKCLVENGATANLSTLRGITPIILAAQYGYLELVTYLSDKGVALEIPCIQSGMTPLMFAAKNGHFGVLKYLCDKGSSISAKDWDGHTALHHAIARGQVNAVEYLIIAGASKSGVGGHTALTLSAHLGQTLVVQHLMESGADVEEQNDNQETALCLASKNGKFGVVKYLVEKGASFDSKTSPSGKTPMHVAASQGHTRVLEFLRSKGGSPLTEDANGWNPLHYAASNGQIDAVQYLCNVGVQTSCETHDGLTPLALAKEHGHLDLERLLSNCDNGEHETAHEENDISTEHDASLKSIPGNIYHCMNGFPVDEELYEDITEESNEDLDEDVDDEDALLSLTKKNGHLRLENMFATCGNEEHETAQGEQGSSTGRDASWKSIPENHAKKGFPVDEELCEDVSEEPDEDLDEDVDDEDAPLSLTKKNGHLRLENVLATCGNEEHETAQEEQDSSTGRDASSKSIPGNISYGMNGFPIHEDIYEDISEGPDGNVDEDVDDEDVHDEPDEDRDDNTMQHNDIRQTSQEDSSSNHWPKNDGGKTRECKCDSHNGMCTSELSQLNAGAIPLASGADMTALDDTSTVRKRHGELATLEVCSAYIKAYYINYIINYNQLHVYLIPLYPA